MSYRVVKQIREIHTNHPIVTETTKYLVAIDYNPYQRPYEHLVTFFSKNTGDAFVFNTEAAAEMAAVFVGGEVEAFTE